MWARVSLALIGLAVVFPVATHASSDTLAAALASGTPEEQGRAIFAEKDARDSGYQDLEVNLEMILRDRSGRESRRALAISQIEIGDAGERLKVVFDTPVQIRGTALLSYSYGDRPDDQWLYLPAMSRVKRIASQNKSGPFLSSEFAFEDMMLQELDKFSYRFEGIEPCGDGRCYRVERRPLDTFSGYTRQSVWLEMNSLRVEQIDYFDRGNRPLKVLTTTGYRLFEDRFWKAERMQMENLQTGKSTELIWRDYRFRVGLVADRDFSTNSLARAR
ncbi:MAG: outer membrane lipoprotein-sorting protein [Pseudomonadales bacterium]